MTSQLRLIFPVSVFHHKVHVDVSESIKQSVHAFIEKNPDYARMTNGEVVKTSFNKSRNSFIEDAGLSMLHSEIMVACQNYIGAQDVSVATNVAVQSWLNIFEPNAVESVHEHFGSFLSGCYYVDTPKDCGEIVFKQEATRRAWAAEYSTKLNTDLSGIAGEFSHLPTAGELLVFPSWLPHEVMRNRSTENRISIAFNLNAKGVS